MLDGGDGAGAGDEILQRRDRRVAEPGGRGRAEAPAAAIPEERIGAVGAERGVDLADDLLQDLLRRGAVAEVALDRQEGAQFGVLRAQQRQLVGGTLIRATGRLRGE